MATRTIQVTVEIQYEYDEKRPERTANTQNYLDAVAKDLTIRPTSHVEDSVRVLEVKEPGTENNWWVGEG